MNTIKIARYMNLYKACFVIFGLYIITGCTKLDTPPESQLTSDNFPKKPEDFIALTGPAYTSFRAYPSGFFNLQEASTDELVVPTRGGDWEDGGNWRNLHYHTWTKDLGPLNDGWNWGFGGIATCNQIINLLNAAGDVEGKTQALAEVRVMRAMYYYCMMDAFGNIPIIDETSQDPHPPTKPRADVFNFIETDLTTALPDLSDDVSQATYGRPTKYVANMLLAKLYLNAEVYTGAPKWTEADNALQEIISSAKFSLELDPLSMFRPDNGPQIKEAIFSIPYDANRATGGMDFQMRTLHYLNQLTYNLPAQPWNGFCTLANFYDSYADADKRKTQWLIGQQYSSTGAPLADGGYSIVFTKDFPKPDFNQGSDGPGRAAGVRNVKYYPDSKSNGANMNNDYIVFRYADVILMKAEVELRKNGAVSSATLQLVNDIRRRAFNDDSHAYTVGTLTLDELYKERGRELSWEGFRRTDMIRFGHWEDAFGFKPANPGETYKRIFPIPGPAMSANPNLAQNPGY